MPEFDLTSPALRSDPYPLYADLRSHAPVYYHAPWNQWILTRYDDCVTVLKDAHFGREVLKLRTREQMGLSAEPPADVRSLVETQSAWMLLKDPPDHTRLRGLVHKAFTPRTVERLRSAVQRLADDAIKAAQEQGEFDLIETIAYPILVKVIAELLGVPEADEPLFMAWSRDVDAARAGLAVPARALNGVPNKAGSRSLCSVWETCGTRETPLSAATFRS